MRTRDIFISFGLGIILGLQASFFGASEIVVAGFAVSGMMLGLCLVIALKLQGILDEFKKSNESSTKIKSLLATLTDTLVAHKFQRLKQGIEGDCQRALRLLDEADQAREKSGKD